MKKKVYMLGDIALITPFIPLILRGRLRENYYLKGDSEGEYPYFKGEIEKESLS